MKNYLLVAINSQYIHTNLAVRYLKSYAKKYMDKEIEIYETNVNNQILQIVKEIYEKGPKVVIFSTYIWNREFVFKIIKELRKIIPQIKIGVGGPEATYMGEEYLLLKEQVDFLIKGEGERAFFKVLNQKIEELKGVYEEQMPHDLDEIPFPYSEDEIKNENKILYYESSRGCPFSCSYCLSSIDKGVRYFSVKRVKEDLTIFLNSNIKLLKFVDRTFNINKERYLEIWRFLIDNYREGITFHFEINANILDDESIELLKRVPKEYFQFEIGVQSINYDTMESINRRNLLDKLEKNVKEINKNIHLHLDLIAGLPHETYDIFKKSFNYVYKLQPEMIQLGFLKILKGTDMEKNSEKYSYQYTEFPPYEVLFNKFLTYDEINKIKEVEKLLNFYYNSEKFGKSLNYIIDTFYSCSFSFFEEISSFYKERKLLDIGHKDLALFNNFIEFCIFKGYSDEKFYEYLKFDYLKNGKPGAYPQWLISEKDSNLYDKAIKERGYKTIREGHKNSELEFFSFNVLKNDKNSGRTALFFDYRDGSVEELKI